MVCTKVQAGSSPAAVLNLIHSNMNKYELLNDLCDMHTEIMAKMHAIQDLHSLYYLREDYQRLSAQREVITKVMGIVVNKQEVNQ